MAGGPATRPPPYRAASVAILEYEEAYRRDLCDRLALVRSAVTVRGNVYDDRAENVEEPDAPRPARAPIANHYEDISAAA